MAMSIQVMGSPLVGSEIQLASLVGGGIYMRDLRVRRRCPRVLMAFSLTGPQRQGLVTLDAKRRNVSHAAEPAQLCSMANA